jgi:predicted nucleic acid-binding protein
MIFPLFVPPTRYPPTFVLDASTAAAWAIPRYYTVYANRVQFRLLSATAVVTSAWAFEVAERFRLALQSGDTTQSRVDRFVNGLAVLPVYADDEGPYRTWPDVLNLARTHTISVLEAAHFELALRMSLPLATIDPVLIRAATAAGIPIFTP